MNLNQLTLDILLEKPDSDKQLSRWVQSCRVAVMARDRRTWVRPYLDFRVLVLCLIDLHPSRPRADPPSTAGILGKSKRLSAGKA